MNNYFRLVARISGSRKLANSFQVHHFTTRRALLNDAKNNIQNSGHQEKNSWYNRVSVQGVLKLKDLFDYLVLGAFGVAIYYAYQNIDNLKSFKKEIDAQIVNIDNFKHKCYSVKDYILPEFIVNKLQELKAFEVRDNDVWIASFPKSGTTWVQELVYLIQSDSDFSQAKKKTIEERSPFFEYPSPGLKVINKLQSPRIIKTHLPIELLPDDVEKKSKVVYVLRNPKDVTISFFYFIRMSTESGYTGGIADFFKLFKEGKVPYGPWWKHVDGFTSRKNIHVIHYEDLHSQPKETLAKLCNFLGKEVDEKKLAAIEKWCHFDNMKQNPMVNYEWNKTMGLFRKEGNFFRKGKVGDWLHHFSTKDSKEYDQMVSENLKYAKELDYGISHDDLNKIYKEAAVKDNVKQ